MPLSCECESEYEYYYHHPTYYSILETKTRKRYTSCEKLISLNSLCLIFECYEMDEFDDEVQKPNKYMCETCSDIFYSLDDLGFCLTLGENMNDLLADYQEIYNEK